MAVAMLAAACAASEVTIGPSAAPEPPAATVDPIPTAIQAPILETDSDVASASAEVSERLPPPSLGALCSDDESEPPPSVGEVTETGDVSTTGLVDLYSLTTTSLSELADGRLPVVVWAWAPCMQDRNEWVKEVLAYARAHDDRFQLVAVGMGGGFLRSLEMADAMLGNDVPVVWSPSGDAFIRRNFTIGSLQLFSVDLVNHSHFVSLTGSDRDVILRAIEGDTDGTWTGN